MALPSKAGTASESGLSCSATDKSASKGVLAICPGPTIPSAPRSAVSESVSARNTITNNDSDEQNKRVYAVVIQERHEYGHHQGSLCAGNSDGQGHIHGTEIKPCRNDSDNGKQHQHAEYGSQHTDWDYVVSRMLWGAVRTHAGGQIR